MVSIVVYGDRNFNFDEKKEPNRYQMYILVIDLNSTTFSNNCWRTNWFRQIEYLDASEHFLWAFLTPLLYALPFIYSLVPFHTLPTVIPAHVHLDILVSATHILCSILLFTAQHTAEPHNIADLRLVKSTLGRKRRHRHAKHLVYGRILR